MVPHLCQGTHLRANTLPTTQIHPGLAVLTRVVVGLGEGVCFPSMHAMLSKWAPPHERSRLGSIVYSGCYLGILITLAFVLMTMTTELCLILHSLRRHGDRVSCEHCLGRQRAGVAQHLLHIWRSGHRVGHSVGHRGVQLSRHPPQHLRRGS
jgi:hypothetical protein